MEYQGKCYRLSRAVGGGKEIFESHNGQALQCPQAKIVGGPGKKNSRKMCVSVLF